MRGLQIFLVLTTLGIVSIYIWNVANQQYERQSFVELLWQINTRYLLLAFSLSLLVMLTSTLQLHVIILRQIKKFPFLSSLKGNLGNKFFSAITPSMTGGGPGQVMILYSEGLKIPQALSIGMIQWSSTIAFQFLALLAVILFARDHINTGLYEIIRNFAIWTMSVVSISFLLIIVSPQSLKFIFHKSLLALAKVLKILRPKINQWLQDIDSGVDKWRTVLILYVKKGKLIWLVAFAFVAINHFIKYSLAYVILLGLGYQVNYFDILPVQVVLLFILYAAPSPGASGIAEIMAAILMNPWITGSAQLYFIALWRFFVSFVEIIFGGVVFLRLVANPSKFKPDKERNFESRFETAP